MLKKLVQQLKGMAERPACDHSRFEDPVAALTDWSPAKGGGTNFKTHKLRKIHAQRMEFRCSLGMLLFGGVFATIGFGCIGLTLFFLLKDNAEVDTAGYIILPLFGLVFGGAGVWMLRSAMTPRVFDLAHGYYCKDRKKPEHAFDPSSIKDYVPLGEVHAIQLLSEYCRGNKSSYTSYELNLVLKDGSRINVIDHGKRSALLQDAETLSQFISKPLWNAM